MEGEKPTTPEADDKSAAKPDAKAQAAPVKPQTTEEQIEGLRAWIAQVERKLGIRSLAGGLAIVLALAAGIVGVVLAMSAKDESATKAEVDSLAEQVSASTKEVSQAAEDDLSAINDRIEALEGRVATVASSQRTTESEIQVLQDDIDELRTDVSDVETRVGELESAPPPDTSNDGN